MRNGLGNYSENMTLEEIGQQLGITKERVRQLNVRIMNKLRTIAREQKWKCLSGVDRLLANKQSISPSL
jgi:DNA-directed RNA polymerase sigma subunit (sigma70/sigma32)